MSMTEVMRAADNLVTATNMVHRGLDRDRAMDLARECYEALRNTVLATIEAEREACAALCEEAASKALGLQVGDAHDLPNVMLRHHAVEAQDCAAAIRKRSN